MPMAQETDKWRNNLWLRRSRRRFNAPSRVSPWRVILTGTQDTPPYMGQFNYY